MRDVDFVETSLTFGRISAVPPWKLRNNI
jgi:hypothetical protein